MAEKLKVLFVIDTLQIGGAEKSLLANTIRFKSIEPIVCHIYKGDAIKANFLESGISVYSLNINRKYGFFQAYRGLKKVVLTEKPDLIVGYITKAEILSRLVGHVYKTPVIGTFITDLYAPDYNKHMRWHAKQLVNLFKTLNRLTSKICIGFVANSQFVKESNSQHLNLPLDKIKVINRGRDSSKIIRRKFESIINNNSVRFLNVSRLFPVKGHKELILGFEGVVKLFPSAILHIAGEGPARHDLEQLIFEKKLEKNVFLLGTRNDIPSILCDYDCFVFPSFMEGFSGSIVEAMFAGLPILASDIGPNKEAIKHEQTGYLFETGSVKAIESAMLWFIKNTSHANEIAKRGQQYALENFELDIIAHEFETYLIDSSLATYS